MANSFGNLFRITTWGESHGGGIGVVVDGCPPRLALTEADIQPDLDRRRPGQSKIVTPRKEADRVEILSGTFEGKTLGTPISMWVRNEDQRPEAYSEMATKFRPSHADYTYQAKYGIRNWQGGGRTSARETIGRVAAGAIAKKLLRERYGVEVLAYVQQVHKISAEIDPNKVKFTDIESNIVRCPDAAAAEKMIRLIEKMRRPGWLG
jgi:chorismate synthase